jgi:glycosyltransferase involved in cell wall biosynthesis
MTKRGLPRVVFVCGNLGAGGAERQWSILIPSLHELGFDVGVVTLDGRGVFFDELRAHGLAVACAGLRHRADPVGLYRAVRLAGRRSSAVVTRGVSAHVVGHVLALRQRAAHIVTEHLGPDPEGLRRYRRHQRLLLAPVRPRATAVVAVDRTQTEHLVRDGYRREAVRVIPNGVASDPAVRDRRAVRAEMGIAEGAFLAVLVAGLRPEKRAVVFVEQVAAAHTVEPSIVGLVVGDGSDGHSVRRAGDRSGGAVRAIGYRADALDIMHAADAVCLTSAVEASPMSVLEAMSVARPVVATDVGGVREMVVDGETGVLVTPDGSGRMAEALVALARDRPRAEGLGRAGRLRQQRRFSIDAMLRGYAELLVEVSQRPGGRRLVALNGGA